MESAFWVPLSDKFVKVARENGLEVKSKFKNLSQWKEMMAYSIMYFMKFSSCLLPSLVPSRLQEHLQTFQNRCDLSKLLCAESFSRADIDLISNLVTRVVSSCCRLYANFCTVNTHMFLHQAIWIKLYGPPKCHWAFPFESRLCFFKRIFDNINYASVSKTIFSRSHSYLGCILVEEWTEGGILVAGSTSYISKRYVTGEEVAKTSEACFGGQIW